MAQIKVDSLDPFQGFNITGANGSYAGFSVSGNCDVNGDGYKDILVMAPYSTFSYVLYGNRTNYLSNIKLADLLPTQGFYITGYSNTESEGQTNSDISCAGFFNSDQYEDIIIGYPAFGSKIGI